MDDDLFAVGRIDGRHRICISSLASKTIEDAEVNNLGAKSGYYIYEVDPASHGGINVLAKAASLEAAFRLIDIFKSIRRAHVAA